MKKKEGERKRVVWGGAAVRNLVTVSADRECKHNLLPVESEGASYEQPLYKESARKGARMGGREVRPVTHELYRTSGQMSPPRTLVVSRL